LEGEVPLRLMRVVRPVDGRGRVVLPRDLLKGWGCKRVALYPSTFAALVLEELRSQVGV